MQIRKIVAHVDESLAERGVPVTTPARRAVAAAVIPNPWLRTSTRADLTPAVRSISAPLAMILTSYIVKLLGSAQQVRGFGKGALIGVDGETEHGAALLHNPYYGNLIRERLEGTEYISFADVKARENTRLVIPIGHKTRGGLRDYFQTIALQIADAPRPDELVVAIAATDGPRPNARIGDRTTDEPVHLAEYADHPLFETRVP